MILTKSIKIIDNKKDIINDEKVEDFDNFYHNQDYESRYLVKNLENKKMSNYNLLENKYYILIDDCQWNNTCILPPNNYNFFGEDI